MASVCLLAWLAAVACLWSRALGEDEPQENRTLDVERCRHYLLHINAHGGGFYQQENIDRYNRCLWVLRHSPEQRRESFVGGHHYPTILVANHLQPDMVAPPVNQPSRPRISRRHADIPQQTFQETQGQFAWLERRRVPHHFLVPYFDVNIGNAIKNQGSMNHYQSYQMQMMVREGDNVVDAGANLGCYTIALAHAVGPAGRVFAFEPFRWIHQVLTANVAMNGLMNVWTVQAALGRAYDVVRLVPPQLRFFSSPGGTHVGNQSGKIEGMRQHEAMQLYDLFAREHELVRIARLDDLLLDAAEGRKWGLPSPVNDIRLIKVDVEGMEVAVMEGAAALIQAFRPIVWSENTAYFDSGGKDVEFLSLMVNLGYQCAKTEVAPTDMICTDSSGRGHQP